MSTLHTMEGFNPQGARKGAIECIAVTATSATIDLSTRTGIYTDMCNGRLLLCDADGADVYYAFSSEAAPAAIDNTNTTAGNAAQCARIPTGALVEIRPPMITLEQVNQSAGAITTTGLCRYLQVKTASGTATLRISIASTGKT